jgi:hypothetical protein
MAERRSATAASPDAWRPSLWHLMLWMTGCAVYFSLVRQFLRRAPDNPGQILLLSALALYTGLCWTGTVIALTQLWGHRRRVLEPGTWLLFSLGCILTVELLVEFLPEGFPLRADSLQIGGTCLALALPTLSRRLPLTWKVWFAVLALLMAAKMVWLLVSLTHGAPLSEPAIKVYSLLRTTVGLSLLGIAMAGDLRLERRYGWLHWTGVLCAVIWLLLVMGSG